MDCHSKLCLKCQRIIEYGARPICGVYGKVVPGIHFAEKCRHYEPYPELVRHPKENLLCLLKEPRVPVWE